MRSALKAPDCEASVPVPLLNYNGEADFYKNFSAAPLPFLSPHCPELSLSSSSKEQAVSPGWMRLGSAGLVASADRVREAEAYFQTCHD